MRLIDADSEKFLNESFCVPINEYESITVVPLELISDAPTIDAKPVIYSRWAEVKPHLIPLSNRYTEGYFICGNCSHVSKVKGRYCHYCGAKMSKPRKK